MSDLISISAGDRLPAFSLTAHDGSTVTNESLRDQKVILYFYPKDNTTGCTAEAEGFRDHLADFEALGYTVIGVSRDSVKSHCNFREKHALTFTLLSDKEETLCNALGVMKEKMMCGRRCVGIERSTFVIDETGTVTHALRNVKAKTHVEELYALLSA